MQSRGTMLFLRKDEWEFLLKFLVAFFSLFILLKITDLTPILNFIGAAENKMLEMVGVKSALEGNLVFIGNSQIEIVPECSGFVMAILLAALLWSTRIKNGIRIKYLLIFTPLLFIFNLLRLLMTILALAFTPAFFDAMHIFLWFVDSAIVMGIWMHAQGIKFSEITKMKKVRK
ncbi:MAG: archaeosortase/exosortase family protein [Candidatus Micrarchaeota archaeon]